MKKNKAVSKLLESIPNNSFKKILEDKRGTVYYAKIENFGFNIIYTKRGGIRGADIHPNTQYDLILKGEFEVWLKKDNKIIKVKKYESELISIPPGIPHLFICLKDSVMIEWWDGKFEKKYFRPFVEVIESKFGVAKLS